MFQSAKNRPRGVAARFALVAAMGLCVLCLSPPAPAAVVTSGNVLPTTDPTTWTSGTTAYIGKTAAGTLSVTEGSRIVSGGAYIGHFTIVGAGEVTLDGTGSTWKNGSSPFYLGYQGSGTLSITGGATLSSTGSSYLAYYAGSTGEATLSGAGSTWTNSATFYVGYDGNGTLEVDSGGKIVANHGIIGDGATSTSEVTLDGAGTAWTDSGDLWVGNFGDGTLSITGGAAASSANGYLGYQSGSTGEVTVDGSGSTWTCASDLHVGRAGGGTLNIANSGLVEVQGTTWVASQTGGQGEIHLDSGLFITKSLFVETSRLTGTGAVNTCGIVSDLDLVLDTADDLTQIITLNSGSGQNVSLYLDLNGEGFLGAGYTGAGSLTIRSGVDAVSTSGYVGYALGATGTAGVEGAGSTWTNSQDLYVGHVGGGTLNVTSGGAVSNITGYVGYAAGSTGQVTVDGASSTWTNSRGLYVGNSGTGTLNITNGGKVTSGSSSYYDYIGYDSGSTGTVTVDGAGSTWTNSYSLYVGNSGNGTLNITSGGKVSNSYGYVGVSSGSTGTVTVDGTDSTWTNSRSLYVGNSGTGTLNITNGGKVSSGYYSCYDYIGYNSGSTGTVTVDGAGSTWTNNYSLYVGSSGTGTLSITNGGKVTNSSSGYLSYVGHSSGSTGTVTVDGADSTWTNSYSLYVGYNGTGTLNITNGGLVKVAGGTYVDPNNGNLGVIHFDEGTLDTGLLHAEESDLTGTGTILLHGIIADMDLVLDSPDDLTAEIFTYNSQPGQNIAVRLNLDGQGPLGAGYSGTGLLAIRNGVAAASTYGYLGYNTGSTGTVTVDGAGSTWTSSSSLDVGNSGTGTLSITNGGKVTSGYSVSEIGCNSGSTGMVTVDGTDSTWTNNYSLYVGNSGTGTLNITNGGKVTSGSSSYGDCIGYKSGSMGTVTVDGAGSTWTNNYSLYVGSSSTGTLSITNGGKVTSGSSGYPGYPSYVGHGSGSTGTVTVDGAGSTWTNNRGLFVGYSGTGTLNIANGGLVKVAGGTYVDPNNKNLGVIHFDGGTLDTGSLSAEESELTGTGTIILHGIIADRDLVFDSPDDLTAEIFTYNSQPGQNIPVRLNLDGQGNLGAGYSGTGSLAIRNGVAATSTDGYIGYNSGSTGTVTVDGAGSTWTNSRSLYVGYSGTGTLNITNGGKVTSGSSSYYDYIGYDSGSTGTVTVDGAGSTWTNGYSLYVGYSGTGTLSITNGGKVSSRHSHLGDSSGSTGTVTVDGADSTWTNSSSLYVGYNGNATLTITEGGLVSAAGTLTIDYDGDGDSFVNIATGGMLALKGNADDCLAAFLGLVSGTDAIRYWDDLTADWAALTAATYGEDYTLGYLTTGSLAGYTLLTVGTVTPPTAGDANQDGKVNDLDASILAANWQRAGDATWATGDFNDDKNVNDLDASILAANWQYGVGAAVPEPALFVLLLGGLAIAAMRRVTR